MGTQEVLDHHLEAFGAGDLEEILADYTESSVMLSPQGALVGPAQLRELYERLFSGLFAPGTYDFTMDAVRVDGEVALITWHATCREAKVPFGTDTFIVRDGKIVLQTFAAKIDPA